MKFAVDSLPNVRPIVLWTGVAWIATACATAPVPMSPWEKRPRIPVLGLRPTAPPPVRGYLVVGSVEPRLEWEAFAPPDDAAATAGVTYDLRVWRADPNTPSGWPRRYFPAELVYERRELSEPAHQLMEPLYPRTKYLWSVRARFQLDGEVRATRWSLYRGEEVPEQARVARMPHPLYFRFETP